MPDKNETAYAAGRGAGKSAASVAANASPLRPPCAVCHSNDPCEHDGHELLAAFSRATYGLARLAGAVEDHLVQLVDLDQYLATATKSNLATRRALADQQRAASTKALRKILAMCTGTVPR